MVIFLIAFYLILISIYVVLSRPNSKKIVFVKKQDNKVRAFKGNIKCKFFCSKFSNEYKIFKKIQNAQFEFEKESQFDIYNNALQKSGIDFREPIFKLELYQKNNYENLVVDIYTYKNLEKKGIKFNLFVFVDSYDKLKKVKKILDIISFKTCLVRAYHCLEIDYKLLGAINFFNLNKEEVVLPKTKKQALNDLRVFDQSRLNSVQKLKFIINKNNIGFKNASVDNKEFNFTKEKLIELKNFSGLFLEEFDRVFKVDDFVYKDLFEQKNIRLKNVEINVKKTFDFENNSQFFALRLHNIASSVTSVKICFGSVFENLTPKISVYVNECKNGKININLKTMEKNLLFLGCRFEKLINKNFMGVYRNIKLFPNETIEVCFAKFLDLKKFKDFDSEDLLNLSIDFITSKYKSIVLPRVFSENKGINDLINYYLPQKIFENTITNVNANYLDFVMLKNLIFDAKTINKDFVNVRLSNIYLLRQNLFNAYQNLLYFYFGIFPNKLGANINTDKSLILKDATTSFEVDKKRVVVRFKNLGLKDEIEINNIKYSNLKFLTFNNYKDAEVEVLY